MENTKNAGLVFQGSAKEIKPFFDDLIKQGFKTIGEFLPDTYVGSKQEQFDSGMY